MRKGERGTVIVFYKPVDTDGSDQALVVKARAIVARASRVFNAAQVDGWRAPSPLVYSEFQKRT